MAPKLISFDEDARRALERGMDQLANAVKMALGPKGGTWSSRRSGARPRSRTTGSLSRRRSSSRTRWRRSGRSSSRRSPRRPTTWPATSTATATVLAQSVVKEGLTARRGRRQPDVDRARHREGRGAGRRGVENSAKEVDSKDDIAHVGAMLWPTPRSAVAEAVDKVGKDSVLRRGQHLRDGAQFTEGMRFDKGYISVLHHRPGADGGGPRRAVRPDRELQDTGREGPAAGAREGDAGRQVRPWSSRRTWRARRSPRSSSTRSRHIQVHLEGARVRRSPQGDAAGHRDPSRRPSDLRGGRTEARERHARPARNRPQGRRHEGRDDDRRGGGKTRTSRADRPDQVRSRRPTRTTTARSSRSGWPSSPAASR